MQHTIGSVLLVSGGLAQQATQVVWVEARNETECINATLDLVQLLAVHSSVHIPWPFSPVYHTSFVQPTLSGFLAGSVCIGPRCRHRYVSRLQNAHSAARNEAVETVAPSNLNSITLPSSSCIGQVGSAS